MMDPHPQVCAYCGEECEWPDDFPDRHFAQCFECHAEYEDSWPYKVEKVLVQIIDGVIGVLRWRPWPKK